MKLIAIIATAALLAGCPQSPYQIDGCIPHEQRCAAGQDGQPDFPQRCSGSRRWTSTSSMACSASGLTCCWTASVWDRTRLVTTCVPQSACIPREGGQ